MTETLRLLLGELIDYAGLFPPAALPMSEAVGNYGEYLKSDQSWMLGRFITPTARLEEFERAADSHLSGARPWRLSVLGGSDLAADLRAIAEFNQKHSGAASAAAVIDALEIRATGIGDIEQAMSAVHDSGLAPAVYIEIPIANDPRPLVSAIARAGGRAKARTGGLTPEAFPASGEVARFLAACAAEGAAFKATAGLHHPLRAVHRLTYEPNSVSGLMHGFLNVFLAAAWLRAGLSAEEAVELLEEKNPAAFRFGDEAVDWRDRRLTKEEIINTREGFAVAFGSCSFCEPIEDLRALGLLEGEERTRNSRK